MKAKYFSGRDVALGDQVEYNGQRGRIVAAGWGVSEYEFSGYVDTPGGVLIHFDNSALLVIPNPREDPLLVKISPGPPKK